MKTKKILILANDTTYTFNLRREVIESIVSKGSEVVVASQPLLLQNELKEIGCRLINVEPKRHGTNPIADLGLLIRYISIISKEKPDVVLTYNIKPNVYGGFACCVKKTPYIANITGLGTAVEYPGIMQKISTRLYKIGLHKASCVFFQNDENEKFFINHKLLRKSTRTRLIPGSGVSLTVHMPVDYPPENESINFLFIARVMKEKGIDLYLEAAKRVHRNNNCVHFHICGGCDDERYINLLREAESSGYISYHGQQKDMIPFFTLAHCIVHPSFYPEGMSNVLLEAAAHCRPIITTDRAGCRETVDNGITGFVIPINNEDALVDALNRFLSLSWEEKRRMGIAGRRKIEAEFDRQIVAEAYNEEIERIPGNE